LFKITFSVLYFVGAGQLNFSVQCVKINRRVISEIDHATIVALVEESHSQRFVVERIGGFQSDVSRIWNRYLETNYVRDRPRSGRRRVTNEQQNRYITLTIRRNRTMPVPQLQRDVTHVIGVRVSTLH